MRTYGIIATLIDATLIDVKTEETYVIEREDRPKEALLAAHEERDADA